MRRVILSLMAPLMLIPSLPASAAAILGAAAEEPAAEAEPAVTGAIEAERDANEDQRIAERIRGIFAAIDSLSHIEVSVEQGVVSLRGTVAQPEQVEQAIDELQMVRLCELLYEISTKLGSFYDKCRVIGSEEQASRLVLMEATRKVMKQTFDLLGMKTLEKI